MPSENSPEVSRELEALFRQEYTGLCRYAYRIVNDTEDAAEVVQETFLRYYRVRNVEAIQVADRALLYRLARNVAIDSLRRAQTRQRLAESARVLVMRTAGTPEEVVLGWERRDWLRLALRALRPRELECLTLRHNGLSYHEIAAVLDLNPGSVGPTIARALRRLRELYASLSQTKVGPDESRAPRARRTDRLPRRPAGAESAG